eukprot:TRINITY_DN24160_c0_g1_i1.p1 TRINITY_DN24160_c0_g1~~TRINITY_DN24160_c0_g1_i1.p1  ORF type:complete len:507 (-),score=56.60 TRINITY_DN24160_c0_g1_i1:211-1731(-)
MSPPESSPAEPGPRPRLTRLTLFVLGTMNLVDCINATIMIPYIDRMVADFLHESPKSPNVVQTVGLLIGLYSFCEVLFSVFWGKLSDRIGRKPTLLIGLGGSIIAPIIIGLAPSLQVVFAARFLDGFFCGNIGVTKTYLGEIVDASNEARGFSIMAVCFSVGLFVGPALGGELVFPAQTFPSVFSGTLFDRYPYLLPNLVYACFTAIAWVIGAIYLEETYPRSARRADALLRRGRDHTEAARSLMSLDAEGDVQQPRWRCCARCRSRGSTGALWSLVLAYALLSGYATAWSQNFALIVSLPRTINGFGFGPQAIGALQNCSGVGLLVTQLFLYPYLTDKFGFLKCFVIGSFTNILATVLFPVYGLLADPEVFHAWRYVPLGASLCVGQAAFGFCFPTIFVWINRAAQGMDRGAVNGWANSVGALARAVFPPLQDALLSLGLGLETNVSGGRYLPVFANALVYLVTLVLIISATRRAAAVEESAPKPRVSEHSTEASSRTSEPLAGA